MASATYDTATRLYPGASRPAGSLLSKMHSWLDRMLLDSYDLYEDEQGNTVMRVRLWATSRDAQTVTFRLPEPRAPEADEFRPRPPTLVPLARHC